MKEAILAAIGIAIVVLLAVGVYQNHRRFHKPAITTPYQAVVLGNGSTFYGRIDHLGTDYPVLREPFIVRRELDPATQQPRYIAVKRKDDLTGADHMIFPASSIAYVEPVRPDSAIGKLIADFDTARNAR
jgi:hypothetical protein